jgi:hypothetical protein
VNLYHGSDTFDGVRGEYNITRAGLRNAAQYGITPVELFEVIDSSTRLFSRAGDRSMLVLGSLRPAGIW